MWTSENNWYKWKYGDGQWFGRQTGHDKFITSFSCNYIESNKTLKEELEAAASSTVDHFGNNISILFSGGADSEVMLRSFLSIGIKPKVFIYRYEKDYNIYDVSYAVTICSLLNVDYRIIDFNLENFYLNDAEYMSELSQIDRPRALPYCKFIKDTDGVPLLGSSDLSIVRINKEYTEPGDWRVLCWEHDVNWSKFIRAINKPAVGEWFKWTPGLVASFVNTNWCKNLVNDRLYGKLGTNSTKLQGYREAYPDMITRTKKTGFEYIDALAYEFEVFLKSKYNGLPYRNYYIRPFDKLLEEMKS
jgi:hypothetical protein